MDSPQADGWASIITHVHTDASTAETSELNDRIGSAIRRCAGDRPIRWAECFTPIERLEAMALCGRGDHGPVHMIIVTDHMRSRSHRLQERHLAVAARTRRLALGAELATRTLDVDGRYRRGPEILAFGGPALVEGPHGPYYGLTQELIDDLYLRCLDDDGRELCTRRTRDLLQERGIAHALSHPLDGHRLSLEGMLAIICEFDFIETMNGGYSGKSALVLDALVRLNNALVEGAVLEEGELSLVGRRTVDQIRRHGRRIYALSGSDAHDHDFDRVVTGMTAPQGRRPEDLLPGDLFATMLELADEHTRRGLPARGRSPSPSPFLSLGRAATSRSLLADVTAIILKNVRENIGRCHNAFIWNHIALTTLFITQDELRRRRSLQQQRLRRLRREFDPVHLLGLLRWPAAPGRGVEAIAEAGASAQQRPQRPAARPRTDELCGTAS